MTALETAAPTIGTLLRQWRQRRRLSQLDLAVASDISARHLSFVETGRSRPTSAMILRLSEQLDVPLRERNALLLAGGFAPAYAERDLDRPELAAVLAAFRRVLAAHQPYPALLVNRWWELVESNEALGVFTDGAAPDLLEPPVNVLRLACTPDGMATRVVNLAECRGSLLRRLRRQADVTGDARLDELYGELRGYPGGETRGSADVVMPLRYRYPRPRTRVLQHRVRRRLADGRHRAGARRRVVLPGRRGDGGDPARLDERVPLTVEWPRPPAQSSGEGEPTDARSQRIAWRRRSSDFEAQGERG